MKILSVMLTVICVMFSGCTGVNQIADEGNGAGEYSSLENTAAGQEAEEAAQQNNSLVIKSNENDIVICCGVTDRFDEEKNRRYQDEQIFFNEYQMMMHPDMVPESEHERKLLMRLGNDAQTYRQRLLEEMKTDPRFDYEILKDYNVQLLAYVYGDFDQNGSFEMFVEVGIPTDMYLWYVNDASAVILESSPSSYTIDVPVVVNIKNQAFVIFKGYGDVSTTKDAMYGLRDDKPDATTVSGRMIEGITAFDELLVLQSAHDATRGGTGHTWKPYYFYLSDSGNFREYGGIEITSEELFAINGSSEIMSDVLKDAEEYEISNILYRDNGIIHVNCVVRTENRWSNQYITLRSANNQVTLENTGPGIYISALLPEQADYPLKHIG